MICLSSGRNLETIWPIDTCGVPGRGFVDREPTRTKGKGMQGKVGLDDRDDLLTLAAIPVAAG